MTKTISVKQNAAQMNVPVNGKWTIDNRHGMQLCSIEAVTLQTNSGGLLFGSEYFLDCPAQGFTYNEFPQGTALGYMGAIQSPEVTLILGKLVLMNATVGRYSIDINRIDLNGKDTKLLQSENVTIAAGETAKTFWLSGTDSTVSVGDSLEIRIVTILD